jgi:hypothetical protein
MRNIAVLVILAVSCNGCAMAAGAAVGGLVGVTGGFITEAITGPKKMPDGVTKENLDALQRQRERLNNMTYSNQREIVEQRQQQATEKKQEIEQAQNSKDHEDNTKQENDSVRSNQ